MFGDLKRLRMGKRKRQRRDETKKTQDSVESER